VLRSLPLPFAAAFGTLMFLLLLQFLIRYLPELVGRGLPAAALFELVAYSLAYMVTLAVPMAWLIALLAAFGRLSESRAYAVVRAAGVSLVQLSWPVVIAGALLGIGMAYFNNVMLPEANYRMAGLWRDIRLSRPAFELEPGTFYTGLEGYAVRAEAVPTDSGGWLHGVTVFDDGRTGSAPALAVAARARLGADAGGRRLVLMLEDGELHRRARDATRYERLAFRRHRLALDLSDLGFERRAAEGGLRGDRTMRSGDMLAVVDSIEAGIHVRSDCLRAAFDRMGRTVAADTALARAASTDTTEPRDGRAALAGLDAGTRAAVYDLAYERARALQRDAETARDVSRWERQRIDRYLVEVYKKNSMALACLIFVLVGVPLGLAVARAGVGLIATLAVGVFLFYWVTLVQGEKLADRGLLSPELGMWAANLIVGLLGLYLTTREFVDPAWRDPLRRLVRR
jgi:lipopolysaccharide export system permease protein